VEAKQAAEVDRSEKVTFGRNAGVQECLRNYLTKPSACHDIKSKSRYWVSTTAGIAARKLRIRKTGWKLGS